MISRTTVSGSSTLGNLSSSSEDSEPSESRCLFLLFLDFLSLSLFFFFLLRSSSFSLLLLSLLRRSFSRRRRRLEERSESEGDSDSDSDSDSGGVEEEVGESCRRRCFFLLSPILCVFWEEVVKPSSEKGIHSQNITNKQERNIKYSYDSAPIMNREIKLNSCMLGNLFFFNKKEIFNY